MSHKKRNWHDATPPGPIVHRAAASGTYAPGVLVDALNRRQRRAAIAKIRAAKEEESR